jgi:hypothetical protein
VIQSRILLPERGINKKWVGGGLKGNKIGCGSQNVLLEASLFSGRVRKEGPRTGSGWAQVQRPRRREA